MARVPRRNFWAAARGGIVLLLMTTLMTGFGEPDGLILGSSVAGTPTVGILGGASANGTQVSGEVVQLNLGSTRPTVVLLTTAGYVTIVLADPLMAAGLGVGVTATFVGEYVSADLFNGYQVISNTLAGPVDLTLGDPVNNPDAYGAPLGGTGIGTAGGSDTGVTLGGTVGGTTGSTTTGTSSLTSGTTCSSRSSSSTGNSCPKLSLDLSDDEVDRGETFKITLEANDDDGIETIWWWASSTDDGFLEETHILDCGDATRCRKSFNVSTDDKGEITIHAQARDSFGMLSPERTEKIDVKSSGNPTATKTATTATPTATTSGTPTACSSTQSLTFTPESGSATTGNSHKVNVTVNGTGDCSGKKVYLEVVSGPNNGATATPKELDSNNQATLSYVGTQAGTDSIRVWLDYADNADYDTGEPTMLGTVKWTAATATPTRTPTRTSTPTRTPTATAGITKQSSSRGTPTPTRTRR